MSIFDKYSLLDPAKMLREIDAETDGDTFDNFSLLDPERARRQLSVALDCEISNAAMLDPALLQTEVDVAVAAAAGSDLPEWVPTDAKIYIDLVNDRAWTEADGEVAINTLLGTDANTVNYLGPSSYDPETWLTADGYRPSDGAGGVLGVIGGARAKILAGATVTMKVFGIAAGINQQARMLVMNDNLATYAFIDRNDLKMKVYSDGSSLYHTISNAANVGDNSINQMAFTYVPFSRFDIAANGLSAVAGNLDETDGPYQAVAISSFARVQTITIYDALTTTAGLQGLSAIIPENAKIHIDLVKQFAWTEADGIVAIDALLGTDANTSAGYDDTVYDAAQLTADGYVRAADPFALIGSARTFMNAGGTMRAQSKYIGDSSIQIVFLAANGSDALNISLSANSGSRLLEFYSFGGSMYESAGDVGNVGTDVLNAVAITLVDGRLDAAANGSTVISAVPDSSDRPAGNPLVAWVIDAGTLMAMQSITIYDALPSTAGLSALSETGVTNTAPSSLTVDFSNFGDGGDHATSTTVADSFVGTMTIAVHSTDPDGNPCQYSVVDDAAGRVTLFVDPKFIDLNFEAGLDHLTEPTINFTLRASDPGGLYVEQEFTITVTSSIPDWVPDGAITVLDFKNVQYWFGGQEHTQGETIEENTDWGSFDPAKIVEGVGVRATGSSGLARTKFVLTTAAAAGLMPTDGGFTAVATFSNVLSGTDGQAQTVIDVLDLSTFNVEWSAILLRNQTGQSNLLSGGDDAATPVGADATAHVAAFTLSPTHIAGSVDGNAVDAVDNIIDNSAATHIAVQVQVFLTDATGTAILEKLVFYAPVENAALPALSTP